MTDHEWSLLVNLLPPAKAGGRPRSVDLRRILNGIFYLVRTGCAWRYLPHEYGCWSTVHHYFRLWRLDGTWERIHARLRERVRLAAGREPTPSGAIFDSQSVKTTERGGPRGFDGAKKVNGRKRQRHLLVDTLGLVLKAVVHPANLHDRDGGKLVLGALDRPAFPQLAHIWADQGYAGTFPRWTQEHTGVELEVVYPWWRQMERYAPNMLKALGFDPAAFHVLPRRWVVERTFAWLGRPRRMSKDYEYLPASSEAMVYLTMIHLLLTRLARSQS